MPNVPESAFFLEPSDYSLLFARVAGLRRPVVIEELREVPLSEKTQIEEIIRDISAGKPETLRTALRPAQRLHLANSEEARHYQTPAALQKYAAESPKFSAEQHGWFAITPAREGSGAPWLLAAAAPPAHLQSLAPLGDLQIKPANTFDAALYSATAVAAALKLRKADVTVFCVDLGSTSSHAMLVTAGGIESLTACALSIDTIAEAVQAELALKFKGSAAKLFFNGLYDFTEAGPKIVDRLETALLASLKEVGGNPTEFYCAGLPAKQQWLATQIAAKLALTVFQPDVRAWCAETGISFADSALEQNLSPAWLGFLNFISVQCTSSGAWSAGWTSLDTPPPPALLPPLAPASATPTAAKPSVTPPVPAILPAAPAVIPAAKASTPPPAVILDPPAIIPAPMGAAPSPVAAAKSSPPPAVIPAPPPTPAKSGAPQLTKAAPPPPTAPKPEPKAEIQPTIPPAKNPGPAGGKPVITVKPTVSPSAVKVTPPAVPVTLPPPPPTKVAPVKPAPSPAGKIPPSAAQSKAGDSSAIYPPKPTVAAKPVPNKNGSPAKPLTPSPAPAVAAPITKQPIVLPAARSTRTNPPVAAPSAVKLPGAAATAPKKKKTMLVVVAIVVVLLLGAGIIYFLQQQAENQRVAAEKARQEQVVRDQAERQRAEAQRVLDAAIAKKKADDEAAAKLAAAQAAQKKKDDDERAQAAAHLAAARGSLLITTDPPGATVTVGALPPRPSPATFTDLKLGKYPVLVTMPQHDEMRLELEVKENAVTESGVLHLVRPVGRLEVTSDPAGATFEFHPANALILAPDARHTGATPAAVGDLSPGDYSFTLERPGAEAHTGTVTVNRDATARIEYVFPLGTVKINSVPGGATVTRGGANIGVTPLTLAEQNPGDVQFQMNLDGYEPADIVGHVDAGKTLTLSTVMRSLDRIATLAELDQKPQIIVATNPEIPTRLTSVGGKVEIELVVTREGTTRDLRVLSTPNAEAGRICLEAASHWRFKPGMIQGRAVNVRVVVPFVLNRNAS